MISTTKPQNTDGRGQREQKKLETSCVHGVEELALLMFILSKVICRFTAIPIKI
jgi:hypothetical protein